MEGLWSRMAKMILSMYCLRRRLISSCSFKASTSWARRGMHYKRSYIKNNHFIQPAVTDQPHLWKRCQSQLPGTGPWFDRRTGSWPRTSSDWESERSGRRFDRAACGSPTDTKDPVLTRCVCEFEKAVSLKNLTNITKPYPLHVIRIACLWLWVYVSLSLQTSHTLGFLFNFSELKGRFLLHENIVLMI